MADLLLWTTTLLIVVGGFLALGGMLWYRGARLLRFFFEMEVNPELGFWATLAGALMVGLGIAMLYVKP